ncbi:uncharacterized protein LOC134248936 [Saccostrea cucullata]|uniref:uncharacterized protein LOC134248936 n=1 Tax=Saccostrea cuccullata TaxID=36930 RepID=UPI002ED6050A
MEGLAWNQRGLSSYVLVQKALPRKYVSPICVTAINIRMEETVWQMISVCATNVCMNGGLCEADQSSERGYKCNCVYGYVGDNCTGDAMLNTVESEANLSWMDFSTIDRDNDRSGSNCAELHRGGWWFNACYRAFLNGPWSQRE